MNDLVAILSQLTDVKGRILIDGIYDQVAPVTEEEKKLYGNIDFDIVRVYICSYNFLWK